MIVQHKLEQQPEWMDLRALEQYACVSERKVREWIHRPENSLPAVQVERGKFLIKRTQFDKWLEAHLFRGSECVDLNGLVDEVMKDIKGLN